MIVFDCPWCGSRSETEFIFGGEAHIQRPKRWQDISDREWSTYLYMQPNPRGIQFERWCHVFGCGEWFNVARHTVTHKVLKIYQMGEPAPEISE